jgi:hypothetical protein
MTPHRRAVVIFKSIQMQEKSIHLKKQREFSMTSPQAILTLW